MKGTIEFNNLANSDLIMDATYEGDTENGNLKDKVLSKLLGMQAHFCSLKGQGNL